MIKLAEQIKKIINEATDAKHPDLVRGYLYVKKDENHAGYSRPLTIRDFNYDKNKSQYPFRAKCVSDMTAKAIEKLYFINEEDAKRWPEGSEISRSNRLVNAVRVDINGDIPCYADVEYLEYFTPESIAPEISERLKGTPVSILSKAQEKKYNQRSDFIEYLKEKYNAEVEYQSNRIVCVINSKAIDPNTDFEKCQLLLILHKNDFSLEPLMLRTSYNFLDEEVVSVIDKYNDHDFNSISNIFHRELNKNIPELIKAELLYSGSSSPIIVTYNIKLSGEDAHLKIEQLRSSSFLNTVEISLPDSQNVFRYNENSRNKVDNIIAAFKPYCSIKAIKSLSYLINTIDFIKSYNEEEHVEKVHIKVKDLEGIKPIEIEEEFKLLTNEQLNHINNVLIEYCSQELRENDVFGAIEKVRSIMRENKNLPAVKKLFDIWWDSNTGGSDILWYTVFKDLFDINTFEIPEVAKQIKGYLWFTAYPHDKTIDIPTIELLNQIQRIEANGGTVILPENVNFDNVRTLFNDCKVRVPSSAKGYLDIGAFSRRGNLFEFEPIKDENGELVSPFTILKEQYNPEYLKYFKVIK